MEAGPFQGGDRRVGRHPLGRPRLPGPGGPRPVRPRPLQERPAPNLPLEAAKLALLPALGSRRAAGHLAAVPAVPVPLLFERAWDRAVPPAAR